MLLAVLAAQPQPGGPELRYVANAGMLVITIRPRRVVGMHLPPGDADRVAAALRAAKVSATLPPAAGSVVALEP